jgi:chitodextrinase
MKKGLFMKSILVIALVFGMAVIACHNFLPNNGNDIETQDLGGNNPSGNNSGGNGNGSGIPNIPTGISASANSSSSITITWKNVSGASGYRIYCSSSSSGSFRQVGSTTSTSYTNTGLSANTTYYYKITAYNSKGESSQSTAISVKTSSSSGDGNPFVGTWYNPYKRGEFIFRADLTVVSNLTWLPGTGTYTYTGNTAKIKFRDISQNIRISNFGKKEEYFTFDSLFYYKQ